MNTLVRVGLLALVPGILVRLFMHTSYAEFSGGVLIGLSLVFIVFGAMRKSRA